MQMNFKIGEIHPNTPHLFADLAELLLLTGVNGKDTIHKNDLEAILLQGTISHEEVDDESSILDVSETGAERNVKSERQLEDVFTQLEYRSSALTEYYPFDISGDELIIKGTLHEKHRV